MLHSPLWATFSSRYGLSPGAELRYKREKWLLSLFMIYDNRGDALSKKLLFWICRSAPFPFIASLVPWGLFSYFSIILMHFSPRHHCSLLGVLCMLHTICEMPLWDFLRSKDFHFSCAFLTEQGKALTFFILRASSRFTNIYGAFLRKWHGGILFICLQIEPLSCFPCIGVHPCARLVIEKMLQSKGSCSTFSTRAHLRRIWGAMDWL